MTLWTAGLDLGEITVVGEEALIAAKEMGLSVETLKALEAHQARPLADETRPTSLLAWITEPKKINARYDAKTSRAEHMMATALKLGATLMVIPEADEAWHVKQSKGASWEEKVQAYRTQARCLRGWAEIIASFVPRGTT